jgi:Kef-type K+ transport system membrane component KefB
VEPSSIVVIALAICLFAAFSRKAERSPLTPPMFFLAVGLFLGGAGLGWVHVDREGLHVLAELTLVLVLFTDAARIDLTCLRRERSLGRVEWRGTMLAAGSDTGAATMTEWNPFSPGIWNAGAGG